MCIRDRYDLVDMQLKVSDSRREDLLTEIEGVLGSRKLLPAHASKLGGKLRFGASHFWGKVGRAFLRPLSERQYSRIHRDDVNEAIRTALLQWCRILRDGRPRSLDSEEGQDVEAVVFTDGFTPDARKPDEATEEPRIGGVLFSKELERPVVFTREVEEAIIEAWLPRKNQIALIELFAVIVAVETFKPLITAKRLLIMIDSESALGWLVKGYSALEDICDLVGVFWQAVDESRTLVYLDRIPTDSNPADAPSRNRMGTAIELGWVITEAVMPGRIFEREPENG